MPDDDDERPVIIWKATLYIRVAARGKMAASNKINLMFNSSAVGLRDYQITDIHPADDDQQ
jgi:hypothetical protein